MIVDPETIDKAAEAARQRVRLEVRAAFPMVVETPLLPWAKLTEADRQAWRGAVEVVLEVTGVDPIGSNVTKAINSAAATIERIVARAERERGPR